MLLDVSSLICKAHGSSDSMRMYTIWPFSKGPLRIMLAWRHACAHVLVIHIAPEEYGTGGMLG